MVQATFLFMSILALFFQTVHGQNFYSKNPNIMELNLANFDRVIHQTNYTTIVEFYAPWCGYCQQLKPAYEKLGKTLKDVAPVQVAAVNCDLQLNKKLCAENKIESYPSLVVFRPPKVVLDNNADIGKGRRNKKSAPKQTRTISKHASELYKGERTFRSIKDFLLSRVKNYIRKHIRLEKLYKTVTSLENKRPQVLLIGKDAQIPLLLKSLSIDWLDVIDYHMIPWSKLKTPYCPTKKTGGINSDIDTFFCETVTSLDQDESYLVAFDLKNDKVSIYNSSTGSIEDQNAEKDKPSNNRLKMTNWLLKMYDGLKPMEGLTSLRHKYLNNQYLGIKSKKSKSKSNKLSSTTSPDPSSTTPVYSSKGEASSSKAQDEVQHDEL
ncbi:hypothetical protein ACO0RG_004153 [Hanseniaspora osmophila]